jgi:CRISPR-associated protein Cas5 subtype I-B
MPEGNRAFLSFPLPPRTTVIGLIAGILGYNHNESYSSDHVLKNARIAVQTLSDPHRILSMKGNFSQTKTIQKLSIPRQGTVNIFITDNIDRGFTTQNNYMYMQDIWYRIFASFDDEVLNEFEQRLKERRYYYPPTAGLANLLASIEYIGTADCLRITPDPNQPVSLISAILSKDLISITSPGTKAEIVHNLTMDYDVSDSPSDSIGGIPLTRKITRVHKGTILNFNSKDLPDGFIEIKPTSAAEIYEVPEGWAVPKGSNRVIAVLT